MSVSKAEEKRSLIVRRLRHRGEDRIRIDVKEIWCEGED
jgi:hypothetical protein